MKRFIYIVMICCLVFVGLLCRAVKTQAIDNGFRNYTVSVSERDPDNYNLVAIYDLGDSTIRTSSDIFIVINTNNFYLSINNDNVLQLVQGQLVAESYTLTSRLIEVDLVYDLNGLYVIIYEIKYTTQGNQTQEPIIDGISRTMKTRFALSSNINTTWSSGDLNIALMTNNFYYQANFLLNFAFVGYGETPSDISTWVNNQLSNYTTYNYLIHAGYLAGNEAGYLDGFEDGEDRGYSDGYDAGESDGYLAGHADGLAQGLNDGYADGYDAGYDDGEAGNNAVHPLWAMIHDIAVGIGDILALKLGPGITIGTIIFVPLFFSALGLILWIWRRN